MTRKQLLALLAAYYARTSQPIPARFNEYSTIELQKAVKLFELV